MGKGQPSTAGSQPGSRCRPFLVSFLHGLKIKSQRGASWRHSVQDRPFLRVQPTHQLTSSQSQTPTVGRQLLTMARQRFLLVQIFIQDSAWPTEHIFCDSAFFNVEGERVKQFTLCNVATQVARNGKQTTSEQIEPMSLKTLSTEKSFRLENVFACKPFAHNDRAGGGQRGVLDSGSASTLCLLSFHPSAW